MKEFLTRSHWSVFDRLALLFAALFVTWMSTPLIWPASGWIDVQRVHVFDSVEGQDPKIEVDRILYQSTQYGRYVITIRDATTHLSACVAKRRVPYDVAAAASPIRDKTLKWWAYSEDQECFRWPVPTGTWYAVSRHCWRKYWWVREACNDPVTSNIFAVRAAP